MAATVEASIMTPGERCAGAGGEGYADALLAQAQQDALAQLGAHGELVGKLGHVKSDVEGQRPFARAGVEAAEGLGSASMPGSSLAAPMATSSRI